MASTTASPYLVLKHHLFVTHYAMSSSGSGKEKENKKKGKEILEFVFRILVTNIQVLGKLSHNVFSLVKFSLGTSYSIYER